MAAIDLIAKLQSLKRFSLRTGLIVFLLLCIAMGIAGRWIHDLRRRGAAQRRVIAKCGEFSRNSYASVFQRAPETKVSWFTTQFRHWIDREYGYQGASLHISGDMLLEESIRRDLSALMAVNKVSVTGVYPPEHLIAAFQIPGLKQLTIGGVILSENDSTDWSGVSEATSLETIDFSRHYLSDELARKLAKLPNLKKIQNVICSAEALLALTDLPSLTELSVAGGAWRYIIEDDAKPLSEAAEKVYFHDCAKKLFARLARCNKLRTLSLNASLYLQSEDIKEFCKTSPVVELSLVDASLSPKCLAEFARLPKLQMLNLTEDQLDDDNLTALAGAQKLLELNIRGNTTSEGVERLRKLLPATFVNGQCGPTQFPKAQTAAATR